MTTTTTTTDNDKNKKRVIIVLLLALVIALLWYTFHKNAGETELASAEVAAPEAATFDPNRSSWFGPEPTGPVTPTTVNVQAPATTVNVQQPAPVNVTVPAPAPVVVTPKPAPVVPAPVTPAPAPATWSTDVRFDLMVGGGSWTEPNNVEVNSPERTPCGNGTLTDFRITSSRTTSFPMDYPTVHTSGGTVWVSTWFHVPAVPDYATSAVQLTGTVTGVATCRA